MNVSLKNHDNSILPISKRRCRPLLGTFVEIAAEGNQNVQVDAAINAAFAAIERVHNLMSFHDPESEVSLLNRRAVNERVLVSGETYQVLKSALELYKRTEGLFDITVASELLDRGLLPNHAFLCKNSGGRSNDISLLPQNAVRFLRPLCIDLGGIAKGFAVDQAIEVLRSRGIERALINAGGDMRCLGGISYPVWVRHPQQSGAVLPLLELENAALATSANSYRERTRQTIAECAQFDGRTRRALLRPFSVSVRASCCLSADALTKVVLALGEESTALLDAFDAQAYIIWPENRMNHYDGKGWNEKQYSF